MSFPSHVLSQGIGNTCGRILAEPGAIKLSSGSRSLSRAGIQGKSKECWSFHQHRERCPSVPVGTQMLGRSHSACGAGFVPALGWWRQPHLPCPAHTGAVVQRLVWFCKSQLGKTCALGIWHSCQGSLEWWVCEICDVHSSLHCSPLLPHQGRRMGLPQAWESSCSWLLPCSANALVLQPDPTAFHSSEMSAAD